MSERFELIKGVPGVGAVPERGVATEEDEPAGWVRAGIAALEARLDADRGATSPEERAMLVTLLMSLEDAVAKMSAEAAVRTEETGPAVGVPLAELEAHLNHLGSRVRTRVVYSSPARARQWPRLQIMPWVGAGAAAPGQWLGPLGKALTGLGVLVSAFLIFEFGLSGLVHDRSQQDLLAGFKQAIATTTLDAPASVPAEGAPVALVYIPRLGINEVVVEGTSPDDLKLGPGHLRTAPLPGEFGNSVIAGRRTTYGAPFKGLARLRLGDPIRVTTGQGVFIYRVSKVRSTPAGQAGPMLATLDNRLTLVTSDPAYAPSGRLVVVAKLAPLPGSKDAQAVPVAVAHRPPISASISELGLVGDPLGLVLALTFGQLLALAIWLTVRFSHRWPMSLTILFGAPVVLALAVLFFSNLDRLLPGTL